MNAPLKTSWSAGTLPVSRTAHPSSSPESGPRPTFNPSSVDPVNLALLARLEKTAPTTIPPIHRLDLAWSCELARLVRSDDVPPEVREGACAMLRRSVDGLVRFWARSKASLMPRMRPEDLMQEAAMKVLRATKSYNPNDPEHPENRVPFGAYARTAVLREIQRCGDNTGSDIRRPVHSHDLIRQIARAEKVIKNKEGRRSTDEEIAELLGISPKQVRKGKEARRVGAVSSLDKPVGEDGDATFLDLKADSGPSPEGIVLSLKGREELQRALAFLRWSEREILTLRFGLEDGISLSLEEVGDIFDLTRERIRQIVKQALESLRDMIPRLEEPRAAELFLSIRKPPSKSPDHDPAEGFSAFFEQRKIMIKAASQAKGKNRQPSLNDIAGHLDWSVGLLWGRIHEDPVLRRRWSHLVTRPAGVSWSEWIPIVLEGIMAKHDGSRPFRQGDLYRAMGMTEEQGRQILRRDPALRRRVDECVGDTRKAWWKTQIDSAVAQIRESYDAEAAPGVEDAIRFIGHDRMTVYSIFDRYPDLRTSVDGALQENRLRWWRERIKFGMASLKRSLSADQPPRFEDLAERTGFGRHTIRQVLDRDQELDRWVQKGLAECVLEWRRRKVAAAHLPRGKIISVAEVCAAVGISPSALQDWKKDPLLFPKGVQVATHAQPARKEKTPEQVQGLRKERRRRVAKAAKRLTGRTGESALHSKALWMEIGISETEWYRWRANDPDILPDGVVLVQRPRGEEREKRAGEILNKFLEDMRHGRKSKPSNMPELAKHLGMPARTLSLWYADIPSAKSIIDVVFRFASTDLIVPSTEDSVVGRRHHRDQFRREDRPALLRAAIQKLSAGRNLAKHPLRTDEICEALEISPTTFLKWIVEGMEEGNPVIPADAVIYFKQWPGHEKIVVDHLKRRYSLGLAMAREAKAPWTDVYAFAREWLGIVTKVTVDQHMKKCPEIVHS